MTGRFKHLAVALSATLVVLVVSAACANSNDDVSTSPVVTDDVAKSEDGDTAITPSVGSCWSWSSAPRKALES